MTPLPALASLNGGLTTRLRPRTLRVPKTMIEVADVLFIAHHLRLLRPKGRGPCPALYRCRSAPAFYARALV